MEAVKLGNTGRKERKVVIGLMKKVEEFFEGAKETLRVSTLKI